MSFTKSELIITLSVLYHLRDLEKDNQRIGWGYDLDSINRVISHIYNEIQMLESEEKNENNYCEVTS